MIRGRLTIPLQVVSASLPRGSFERNRRFTVHVRRDCEPHTVSCTQYLSVRRGPIAPAIPVCVELELQMDDCVSLRYSIGAGNARVHAAYVAEKGLVGQEPFRPVGVC